MWKRILGTLWRKTPNLIKTHLVRASQTKFTVSAGVVVTNGEGKVLLLDHVLRPGSGWGIPGGFIEANEQPEDAVRRELCEEINLEIEDIKLFRVKTNGRHVEILFRARARAKGEVNSFEINKLDWFELNRMPAEMNEKQKEVIRKVLAKTGDK